VSPAANTVPSIPSSSFAVASSPGKAQSAISPAPTRTASATPDDDPAAPDGGAPFDDPAPGPDAPADADADADDAEGDDPDGPGFVEAAATGDPLTVPWVGDELGSEASPTRSTRAATKTTAPSAT